MWRTATATINYILQNIVNMGISHAAPPGMGLQNSPGNCVPQSGLAGLRHLRHPKAWWTCPGVTLYLEDILEAHSPNNFIHLCTNTVVELLFAHSPTKTWKKARKADHSPWLQHQARSCTAWDHADAWMDRLRYCMPRGCKFPRGIMAPWESKLKHHSSCASTYFLLHAACWNRDSSNRSR